MSRDNAPSKKDFISHRVRGLLNRINDYETYFLYVEGVKETPSKDDDQGDIKKEKSGKLDHAATTAYINLVKQIISLRGEDADNVSPEEIARAARKVFKEEYGINV